MNECAVFIDGGYFEKLQKKVFRQARVNFQRLAEWMAQPEGLFRTY